MSAHGAARNFNPASTLVAVCGVSRDPLRLTACVRALVDEAANWVIVLSSHDAQRQTAERVARTWGGEVLIVTGSGYAALHNGALEACTAELLSLVDDEVIVTSGWLDALQRAWAEAEDDIAFIGGPLRLELNGAAPRWWRRSAMETFPYHDYGDQRLRLNPRERTLFTGNISFRCDALRGAEGFWPVRGRLGLRDRCTDVHQTQYTLGQLGWSGLYEPSAIAFRTVEPSKLRYRDVLAKRFRSGARAAILSGEAGRTEVGRAALALASAPLRRGQNRALMESAARLATEAGALLAPWVATRDFEPTGPTAFRPFVRVSTNGRSRARTRSMVARGGSATVLVYHCISTSSWGGTARVSPANLAEQLAVLHGHGNVVSVAEIAEKVRARRAPGKFVAITFDDGYADALSEALPLLLAFSLPATVFVATEFVASQEPFFWDEIAQLLANRAGCQEPLELTIRGHRRAWVTRGEAERAQVTAVLQRLVQSLCLEERADALAQLSGWASRCADRTPRMSKSRPLTADELRRLASAPEIDVGSHTRHHTSLRFQPITTQRRELSGASEQLETWLGSAERGFAYPFGTPGVDFDDQTSKLVQAHGHRYAFANVPGLIGRDSDPYALPRVSVPDLDGSRFERWLERHV